MGNLRERDPSENRHEWEDINLMVLQEVLWVRHVEC